MSTLTTEGQEMDKMCVFNLKTKQIDILKQNPYMLKLWTSLTDPVILFQQ